MTPRGPTTPRAGLATGRRLYLDTSAYLCILLGEEGADELSAETDGAELLSSVLLVLEARRSLIRLARENALAPDHYQLCMERIEHDLTRVDLRDLTLDLCDTRQLPAVVTPRTLDLAHLRTALWFHQAIPLTRFLTTDKAQEAAAKELGLPVR